MTVCLGLGCVIQEDAEIVTNSRQMPTSRQILSTENTDSPTPSVDAGLISPSSDCDC